MTIEKETKAPFLKKITPYDKDGKPGELKLVLGNGQTFFVALDHISEQNRTRAMWHGLSQRFGDSVAGCSKDNAYGYAMKMFEELYAVLSSPEWSKGHTGGKVETEQSIEDLISAIAKAKKKPEDAVAPLVQGAEKAKRDEWRKHPSIATILTEIAYKRMKESAKNAADLDFPI